MKKSLLGCMGLMLLVTLGLTGCDKLTHHLENYFKGMETITTLYDV